MSTTTTYLQSTKEGKLFIAASDLFSQPEVQEMVYAVSQSRISREIKKNQKTSKARR